MQRADGGGHRSLFHEERRDAGRHCLPTGLPFLFSFRDAIISRRREKTKRKTKRPAAGTWQRAQRDGTRTWCGHERNDVDSRTRTNSREDKQSEKDTDTKDRQPSFQVFPRFILVPPRCFLSFVGVDIASGSNYCCRCRKAPIPLRISHLFFIFICFFLREKRSKLTATPTQSHTKSSWTQP